MISMTDCTIRVNNHLSRVERANQQGWLHSFEHQAMATAGFAARISSLLSRVGMRRPSAQPASSLSTQPA